MPDLAPGANFAGHRIEGVAGRGGMGVVYRATHLALDHVVALKVISPELSDDEVFRKRFVAESRAAVSIRHPNVVPIHNAGEEDGLLFVTMALIEGADLRRRLDERGSLTPEHAVDILSQIAAALDAAHERGLVHRDIKPGNILIESRQTGEHYYLTDFGLTKKIGSASGVTATDAFVGTLDYVAPEQIRGEQTDARTDVYALGCVLHEMLRGSTPFEEREEKVAKIYAHLQDEPPRLADAAPGVPLALDAVVARAMAKDPEERYPSAGDMGRAASAAGAGLPVPTETGSVATGLAAPAAAGAAPTVTESVPPPTVEAQTPQEATVEAAAPETAEPPPAAAEPTGGGTEADETAKPTVREPTPEPTVREPTPEPARAAPLDDSQRATMATGAPPPTAARRAPDGVRTHRKIPYGLLGGGAAAIAVIVVLIVLLTGGGDGGNEGAGGGDGGAGGEGEPAIDGDPVQIAGMPVGTATGAGEVWVASRTGDQLRAIDPTSGEPGSPIDLPPDSRPEQVVIDEGIAWVALTNSAAVGRVDVETQEVADPIGLIGEFPRGLAVGGGSVWVTYGEDEGSVVSIDPSTGILGAAIPVGRFPHGIAVGAGAVWVSNRDSGTVSRIEDGAVVDEIPVGPNPKGVAIAGGLVWVANTDDGTVSAIDPGTNEVAATLEVGGIPRGVTAAFASIWVANGDGYVTEIDPKDQAVAAKVELPPASSLADGEAPSPEEIAADDEQLWVTTGVGESVVRIEP